MDQFPNKSVRSDEADARAGEEVSLKPGLYLVSTPVGNLRDITLRALDVLRSADLVLCEDTRRTSKLLNSFGLKAPLKVYDDHSQSRDRQTCIGHIEKGQSVALVSDAGTPLVSDPGYKLVRDCLKKDIAVIPVPGANAILPALQLSGFGPDKFCFMGFAPAKEQARRKYLQACEDLGMPVLFYETANRLEDFLRSCREILGDREISVSREITKIYEQTRRGTIDSLLDDIKQGKLSLKGEMVVVIAPGQQQDLDAQAIKQRLRQHMEEGRSLKQAAKDVADMCDWKKSDIYDLALEVKNETEKT